MNTRNEALEFARRTRRNLEFIEKAKGEGASVHVVTQLTVSLLGLVVFPKERLLLDQAERKTIADMRTENWPIRTSSRTSMATATVTPSQRSTSHTCAPPNLAIVVLA
jgi:hypothetical protein